MLLCRNALSGGLLLQQIYVELKSLTFETFSENARSLSKAVTEVNAHILNHALLIPKHHRNGNIKTKAF